jgi:hypothetical protein
MPPDLILGWHLGATRYLFPCILGIQLSVSYLLATQITSLFVGNRLQKMWQLVLVLLVSSGVLSCTISSQAKIWWHIGGEGRKYEYQVADVVNQATKPLLISDTNDLVPVQSLSYMLAPKVRFQLLAKPDISMIPDGFSEFFFYNPSKSLQSELERVYHSQIKLISKSHPTATSKSVSSFWRLETGN